MFEEMQREGGDDGDLIIEDRAYKNLISVDSRFHRAATEFPAINSLLRPRLHFEVETNKGLVHSLRGAVRGFIFFFIGSQATILRLKNKL